MLSVTTAASPKVAATDKDAQLKIIQLSGLQTEQSVLEQFITEGACKLLQATIENESAGAFGSPRRPANYEGSSPRGPP